MKTDVRETVNLPVKGIERFLEAMRIFESAQNEIEDFLISRNKNILSKIKKADKERAEGKVKDFQNL